MVSLSGRHVQKRQPKIHKNMLSDALAQFSSLRFYLLLRYGWVFLERTRILSGIQFTEHSIEFVLLPTKRFVSSNVNLILTQQTCGQRSSMSAGSKRWALAFYFCIQIRYLFLISKCRRESDVGLCTTSLLAKRVLLCIGEFRWILRPNKFFNRKSPTRSCILIASAEIVGKPRSDFTLHLDIRNI